jgi:hypothetical protein
LPASPTRGAGDDRHQGLAEQLRPQRPRRAWLGLALFGGDYYTLRFAAGAWELARGRADPAAVTVVTTSEAWASFLTTPRGKRRLRTREISLEGSHAQRERFAKAFAAKLSTRGP